MRRKTAKQYKQHGTFWRLQNSRFPGVLQSFCRYFVIFWSFEEIYDISTFYFVKFDNFFPKMIRKTTKQYKQNVKFGDCDICIVLEFCYLFVVLVFFFVIFGEIYDISTVFVFEFDEFLQQ